MTDAENTVLDRAPQRGERSEAACAGAWVLWCHGVRDWAEAETFYDRPVFAKYRTRADSGRSHWDRQASQWASYRAPVTPTDQTVIDNWLAAGAHWKDGTAQATLVAVLQTFGDGRGLDARPIACRGLAVLLGCSWRTAARRIQNLCKDGVVERVRGWQDGPSQEAALYTLCTPVDEVERTYRGVLAHDTDTPTGNPTPLTPSLLHPTWQALGHTCRQVWELLTSPLPTTRLTALTHLPRGDASYGLLHQLHRLASSGLIRRTGAGRATTWERTPTSLDEAASHLGVGDRTHTLAQVITAERAVWHAESAPDRSRAATRLAMLRDRLRRRAPSTEPSRDNPAAADDLDTELAALLGDDQAPAPATGSRQRLRRIASPRPAMRRSSDRRRAWWPLAQTAPDSRGTPTDLPITGVTSPLLARIRIVRPGHHTCEPTNADNDDPG